MDFNSKKMDMVVSSRARLTKTFQYIISDTPVIFLAYKNLADLPVLVNGRKSAIYSHTTAGKRVFTVELNRGTFLPISLNRD